ncbi:MAG: hypothetical protein GX839_02875 [Fastidiosipila sp.]|nr:hypothetical protein [Fastidiosipila sp.]
MVVSARRAEDVTEALWGTKVSAGMVSCLNLKIDDQIDEWRKHPLEMSHSYVCLTASGSRVTFREIRECGPPDCHGGERGG